MSSFPSSLPLLHNRLEPSSRLAKRVKWSPDGSLLLASLDSGCIQLLSQNLQLHCEVFGNRQGFSDFAWYPWMSPDFTGSNCFITASKDSPIQLWDGVTGSVRCSWSPMDHLDQLAACVSVSFSPDGQTILAGGSNAIWSFDANRTSSSSASVLKTTPARKSRAGQKGLISHLAFRPNDTDCFAAASFSGSIGIYDLRLAGSEQLSVTRAFDAGVTQVEFSSSGWSVIAAGRHSKHIHEFDTRLFAKPNRTFELGCNEERKSQRIYFDLASDGYYLLSGASALIQRVDFDSASVQTLWSLPGSTAPVSSVSIHPKNPSILAFSAGSRCFPLDNEDPTELAQVSVIGLEA